ncbi:MAG: hypothetical protein KDA66_17780, partial [Planctomycetaceae bacterium]|nr:hypothetical protein [Planctomycetaceae bacterium]
MTGSAPAPDAADDDGSAEPMLPPIDENAETTRDPMEMVASTFMEELRTGKRPSVDDFAHRFPQQAEEIRDLLPMLIALEDVKAKHELDSVKQPLPQQLEIEQLGEYKILREIGRGGMGVVFEALYEKINRRV